jgi:predicted TIM-barrel fold metal-dependent hydrolase
VYDDVRMRIIALEEHVTTPDILKAARMPTGGASLGFMEAMSAKLLDMGEGRIADMDASGIDMQVLSVSANTVDQLDAATAQSLARDANDRMAAAVRAHPDRFAAFATLALQEPEQAAAEFERCVRQLGFKGVMLNGTANGQFLDHPRFTPVFEAAQALDVPIYMHPAPPPKPVLDAYYSGLPNPLGFFLSTAGWGWHVETGMHSLRLIISGVFDRFPKLKIILGHMGENLPFSIARAEMVFGRGVINLQRSIAEYFCEHFHLTTSGYFTTPPFLCMQQVVGIDHIMFSVDYPFSPNTLGRKFLDDLAVSPEDMEKIAHRNAEKLLKLGTPRSVQ